MSDTRLPTLADARVLLEACEALCETVLERAREVTQGGRAIDDQQVLSERVAYAATEARAARELVDQSWPAACAIAWRRPSMTWA
jgi:alkylation response protein AidB-like acyl-CoA dehydrogenase